MNPNYAFFALIAVVIVPARKLYRKRRIIKQLKSDMVVSIGMNHWKKARNEANRIVRIKYL